MKNLIQGRLKLRAYYQQTTFSFDEQPTTEEFVNPVDQQFPEGAVNIVEENLCKEDFNVKQFGYLIGMSGTQLRRKMNALAGKSPNHFIRSIRLKRAARLMKEERYTVSEAAYQSGFNSLSYFSKCFLDEFGKLPSEY